MTFRVSVFAFLALILLPVSAVELRRPNIIVVFTDDHGYCDLSCQGIVDDIRTPWHDEQDQEAENDSHPYQHQFESFLHFFSRHCAALVDD